MGRETGRGETTMTKPSLTELETKVYAAMKQNADDIAGGDFGMLDEMDVRSLGISRQALGGVVTSLQTKGYVNVYAPERVNGKLVQQFTITEYDNR
jgi:hypothetical protein